MNALNTLAGYTAIGLACLIAGLLIIFLPIYFVLGRKGMKRIFDPCQECRFIPSAVTRQDRATGAWHQIQECERCGRKRDAVLSQSTLDSARKFFIGQQP